jgi:hypothetical protein
MGTPRSSTVVGGEAAGVCRRDAGAMALVDDKPVLVSRFTLRRTAFIIVIYLYTTSFFYRRIILNVRKVLCCCRLIRSVRRCRRCRRRRCRWIFVEEVRWNEVFWWPARKEQERQPAFLR